VNPNAQQLVVLVGHTLHWATAGRLPAAKHRIVTPASSSSSSSSSGAARLSLAFKLCAAADAEFDPAAITGIASSRLDSRCENGIYVLTLQHCVTLLILRCRPLAVLPAVNLQSS
jgi:isopenicillin N synthase-like dioxygenase